MKKLMKAFSLLIITLALFLVASCGGNEEVKIESVSVVESSIPSSILTTEVNDKLDDIQLKVAKSDNTVETINVQLSMISATDLAKLKNEGTHTITISYEGYIVSINVVVTKPAGSDPLPDPEEIAYSVLIKDIAGKPLSNFYVTFYDADDEIFAEGYTVNTCLFETNLIPDIYDVIVEGREGYYLNQEAFETDLLGSQIVVEAEIEPFEDVEAPADNFYQLGDVMYDFTLTDIEGNELDLYDLLKDYKAVILNFWYVGCSWCEKEFPDINAAYNSTYEDANGETRKYSDDICIIAVNPTIANPDSNTLSGIEQFVEVMGLDFNVALDNDANTSTVVTEPLLTTMFGVNSYPTTVIIDKYGLIAELEPGAILGVDKWVTAFDEYIDDNYFPSYKGTGDGETGVEEFVKPDIEQAPSSELEAAANGTNHDGTTYNGTWYPELKALDYEYSWPFIVDTFDNKTVIRPSNDDQNNSFATVYTKVYLKKGEAFVFDYYSSTEEYDILYLVVDGVLGTQICGISKSWETSYSYVAIEDG
ncbi:MAG: TlpA family protein disulfide reductase, partial [Acholeplasmatales bacterium]|nr:TlpA family protein disulfide reductase [Acholeplasmatales bacterium]